MTDKITTNNVHVVIVGCSMDETFWTAATVVGSSPWLSAAAVCGLLINAVRLPIAGPVSAAYTGCMLMPVTALIALPCGSFSGKFCVK